jgi:hypothetical protein
VLRRRVEETQGHVGHEHVDYAKCRSYCLIVLSYGTLAVRDLLAVLGRRCSCDVAAARGERKRPG